MEVAECEIDEDGKMIKTGESEFNSLSNFENSNLPAQIRESSRKTFKRLGVLYSDTDQISSPIQRTEENFCENKDSGTSSNRPLKKFTKLASLATNINSWDDDYNHHPIKSLQQASPVKSGTIPKTTTMPSPAKTNSPFKFTSAQPSSSNKTSPFKFTSSLTPAAPASASPSKKLLWDQKVMDSLEAQGFSRRDTTGPKLVYDYKSSQPSTSAAAGISSPVKKVETITSSFVKPSEVKKAEGPIKKDFAKPSAAPPKAPLQPKFTSSSKTSEQKNVRFSNVFGKNQKDPADLSLKDRMAIFEKNKGTAPVPATPYGIADANPIRSNMPELSKKFNFGFSGQQKLKAPVVEQPKEIVVETAAANIKHAVNKLLSDKSATISEQQINEGIRKQREEDMMCIRNRFNKQPKAARDTSEDEEMPEEKSERKRRSSGEKDEVCQKSDDKKRSRVSNTQRLYPVLSDVETTTDSELDNYTTATVSASEEAENDRQDYDDDDYSDDDDINMSFGREILDSVKKNSNLSKDDYLDSTVTSTEVSDAIGDMDDYLNEALEVDESKDYDDKGSACSESFEYERYPKRVSFKDDLPIKSKLEISPSKKPNGPVTLVHTVSFYRRQQSASANNTPVKKVVHKLEDFNENQSHSHGDKSEECNEKIRFLLDEVKRQLGIIQQTSGALNFCASTREFSGSSESVEAERVLLVATHRKRALTEEIHRLQVEGITQRDEAARGTIKIQEIIIPLEPGYVSKVANSENNGHHLLCLLKYNEKVLATQTLQNLPGLKSVKFQDVLVLNEVFADFKITLEIYGMRVVGEYLPHEIKYHIQTPNKKKFKSKLQESNMTRLPTQSPGGPMAVRTPSFVKYGYIIFSIREIKKTSWMINKTIKDDINPLHNNVYLKIDSKFKVDVCHRGFLTMFDDISGFGAWHRRWCRLSGSTLYYWKYPEDENKKSALGQLDLSSIVSQRADVAPRTICARQFTILLESRRERRSDDVESLVLVPQGKHTIVR